MCVVSATHDYMRQRVPIRDWTRPAFDDYQEIIKRLEKLDKKLGQPDCVDPAKAEWMKEVEKRLAELEATKAS